MSWKYIADPGSSFVQTTCRCYVKNTWKFLDKIVGEKDDRTLLFQAKKKTKRSKLEKDPSIGGGNVEGRDLSLALKEKKTVDPTNNLGLFLLSSTIPSFCTMLVLQTDAGWMGSTTAIFFSLKYSLFKMFLNF